MKKILFLSLLIFTLIANAQNVGIGNSTPAEKLDVNGNINVTGTIKANGVDGTANQVLMKSNTGTLIWADLSLYKNFATFLSTGNWTVPSGVTKIAIELWGAGGGGTAIGGGGGGGYILGQFTVTPASVINFTVGVGGAGSSSSTGSGGSGTQSSVIISGNEIDALGGAGAIYNSAGNSYYSGQGGGFSASSGFTNYIGLVGQNGTVTKKNYAQAGPTLFYELGEMGSGGNAANSQNTGGIGVYYISTPGSFPAFTDIHSSGINTSKVPGGGGGSYLVNSFNGANGMVIIHY